MCNCQHGFVKYNNASACIAPTSKSDTSFAAGIAAGLGSLVFLVVVLMLIRRKRRGKVSLEFIHKSHDEPKASTGTVNFRLTELEIGEEIGRGEFGIVFEVSIRSTELKVAGKSLKPDSPDSAQIIFAKEAEKLGSLSHCSIDRQTM